MKICCLGLGQEHLSIYECCNSCQWECSEVPWQEKFEFRAEEALALKMIGTLEPLSLSASHHAIKKFRLVSSQSLKKKQFSHLRWI